MPAIFASSSRSGFTLPVPVRSGRIFPSRSRLRGRPAPWVLGMLVHLTFNNDSAMVGHLSPFRAQPGSPRESTRLAFVKKRRRFPPAASSVPSGPPVPRLVFSFQDLSVDPRPQSAQVLAAAHSPRRTGQDRHKPRLDRRPSSSFVAPRERAAPGSMPLPHQTDEADMNTAPRPALRPFAPIHKADCRCNDPQPRLGKAHLERTSTRIATSQTGRHANTAAKGIALHGARIKRLWAACSSAPSMVASFPPRPSVWPIHLRAAPAFQPSRHRANFLPAPVSHHDPYGVSRPTRSGMRQVRRSFSRTSHCACPRRARSSGRQRDHRSPASTVSYITLALMPRRHRGGLFKLMPDSALLS